MDKRQKRKIFCEELLAIIKPINPRPNKWSYTTSIEYMVSSKKYMDSFTDDINKIIEEIKKRPESNLKVLDFGTGSGIAAVCLKRLCQLENINKDLDITGVDINEWKTIRKEDKEKYFYDMPEHQKIIWKELTKKYGIDFYHYFDILEFFNKKDEYDVIIMYAVYEHISEEEIDKIMSVLKKILKKDGKIYIFKLPRRLAYMEYLTEWLGAGSHDIKFGDREIRKILNRQGFKILDFWHSDLFPSFPPGIINLLHWPLFIAEKILKYTPLVYFSHNDNLIIQNK